MTAVAQPGVLHRPNSIAIAGHYYKRTIKLLLNAGSLIKAHVLIKAGSRLNAGFQINAQVL